MMKQSSLIMHIFLLGISILIFALYVKPTIEKIRDNQSIVAEQKSWIGRVQDVNTVLQQKVTEMESIPLSSKQSFNNYLPIKLDELLVLKTVEAIAQKNSVRLSALEIETSTNSGAGSVPTEVVSPVKTKTVAVSLEGSYQSLNAFFDDVFNNAFPLVPSEMLLLKNQDTGNYTVGLKLLVSELPVEGAEDTADNSILN
jgi:hypothetical protein